ncbi:enoyl-CoA hydratase-related protein [Cupriavidus basilensis]
MSDFLKYEQDGHIVTLTMNGAGTAQSPDRHTAVPGSSAAVERIQDDRSVRAVVITGSGAAFTRPAAQVKNTRAPCLRRGARHGDPARPPARASAASAPSAVRFWRSAADRGGSDGPAPSAPEAWTGDACCDIRIASERARFAPRDFVKLGIIPGDDGAWLLPRIIGLSRAAERTHALPAR